MTAFEPEEEARPVRYVLVADDDPDLNRLVGVRLIGLAPTTSVLPDDLTVIAVRCVA
jgi:hypothetical protein